MYAPRESETTCEYQHQYGKPGPTSTVMFCHHPASLLLLEKLNTETDPQTRLLIQTRAQIPSHAELALSRINQTFYTNEIICQQATGCNSLSIK